MVTIRDIVILEGPDGSGKTTLKERLLETFDLVERPRACTSEGGPVDELMKWLEEDLRFLLEERYKSPSGASYLYDRYPPFSEVAYGPSCRSCVSPGFDQPNQLARRLNDLLKVEPLVIFCMPPKETVIENVMGEVKHMPGVKENIRAIYAMYQLLQGIWETLDGTSLVWDYTQHNFDTLAEELYETTTLNYRKDTP